MNKQEFVDTFLEGVSLNQGSQDVLVRNLAGMVFDLRSTNKNLKTHMDYMDEVARENDIKVECRCCLEKFVPDCELSEITHEGNYCGRSERCCP